MVFYLINIILCFFLGSLFSPCFTIWLNWKGRNRIVPFFLGAIYMFFLQSFILRFFIKAVMIVYTSEKFAQQFGFLYGVITTLLPVVITEYLIFELLSILNSLGKWTTTLTRNMALGFGIGWMNAVLSIGVYCIRLFRDYGKGHLGWFELSDCLFLWNLLITCVLYSIFYSAAVINMEYAIVKGNKVKTVLICIGLNCFIEFEKYFLVAFLHTPRIVCNIIFLIIVYFYFRHGFYKIRTIQYHRSHRKRLHS